MKNCLIFIFLISSFCCKEAEKKINAEQKELIFKMNVEYIKDDNIWLFYSEEPGDYVFRAENSIKKHVYGEKGFQWIVFELPSEIQLEHLKIRFSNNENQNQIKLKEVQVSRNKNILTINSADFYNYFNFSKFISTSDGFQLEFSKVDGLYDPNVVSSSQLENEFIKL